MLNIFFWVFGLVWPLCTWRRFVAEHWASQSHVHHVLGSWVHIQNLIKLKICIFMKWSRGIIFSFSLKLFSENFKILWNFKKDTNLFPQMSLRYDFSWRIYTPQTNNQASAILYQETAPSSLNCNANSGLKNTVW